MGRNTNIKMVGIGGALAIVVVGFLGHWWPWVTAEIPGLEAAMAVIMTTIFSYITPPGENK